MVAATLQALDVWFNEPASQTQDRTQLLSKLAVLELCGWLEGEFDRLIRVVEAGRLNDAPWVESELIDKTNGFHYAKHWRQMLCRVVGEVFVRRVEAEMEAAHPTELEQLRSLLGQLWKDRCSYAHADYNTNVAAQQRFNAPSFTIGQHARLQLLLSRYEAAMMSVIARI